MTIPRVCGGRAFWSVVLAALLSAAGCRGLPIETSFGRLVSIEQKPSMQTPEHTLTPGPGKVLYQLTFDGQRDIRFVVTVQARSIAEAGPSIHDHVLLSAPRIVNRRTGTEYVAALLARPDGAGGLTEDVAWGIKGEVNGAIWSGTLSIPDSTRMLAYIVPADAGALGLKDQRREFTIR